MPPITGYREGLQHLRPRAQCEGKRQHAANSRQWQSSQSDVTGAARLAALLRFGIEPRSRGTFHPRRAENAVLGDDGADNHDQAHETGDVEIGAE